MVELVLSVPAERLAWEIEILELKLEGKNLASNLEEALIKRNLITQADLEKLREAHKALQQQQIIDVKK